MPGITTDEQGNLHVNANLLPLLRKLGVKGGGGGFVMPPLVLPIINIETLEEAEATAQLQSTVTGDLAAVGSAIQITVPTGEIWKVESIFYSSVAPSVACADSVDFLFAGTLKGGIFTEPEAPNNGNDIKNRGVSFAQPVFLAAGEIIEVERINGASTATSTNLIVVYRLA